MRRIKRVASLARSGWWKTACAVCALCAATAIGAIGLHAQTFTTLHSFDYTDGEFPFAALLQATDGDLFGTTAYGGANGACLYGCGTFFEISPNGTLTTLYSFCSKSGCSDGEYPNTALIQANDGYLYGTTIGGGVGFNNGTVFRITQVAS